nr:MAG TPA: hypothetical protein [Caudoviricetes sp.]
MRISKTSPGRYHNFNAWMISFLSVMSGTSFLNLKPEREIRQGKHHHGLTVQRYAHEFFHEIEVSRQQIFDFSAGLFLPFKNREYLSFEPAVEQQSFASGVCREEFFHIGTRNQSDNLQSARCPDPFIKRNIFGVFCQLAVRVGEAENIADIADDKIVLILYRHHAHRHLPKSENGYVTHDLRSPQCFSGSGSRLPPCGWLP